jgi:hypothetical protein
VIELYGIIHDGKSLQYISKQLYRNLMSEPLPYGWQIIHIPSEWQKEIEPAHSFWQDIVSHFFRWFD